MAVRVIKDFWNQINNEKDLINRCFFYILRRCPDPEGQDSAYHNLVLELFLHKVFDQFDKRKSMRGKLIKNLVKDGISKKAAETIVDTQMKNTEYTDEDYKAAGIDLRKVFEQFVFSWINKILREEYTKNSKKLSREVLSDSIDKGDFSKYFINHWDSLKDLNKKSSIEDFPENKKLYGQGIKPSITDTDYTLGTLTEDSLDIVTATDIENNIYNSLKTYKEKFVFKHVILEGRKQKTVARYLKCSTSYIGIIVNNIRRKTESICSL